MKFSKNIFHALLLCLFLLESRAQAVHHINEIQKFRAVHWELKDGLSQACALHMLKDVNGFLWIGTQGGLSRFDGSIFKNYYHDPKKTGTINAKYTAFGLVEDSLHNIWIGTNNGLYRYDIKADTFTRFIQGAPICASREELFCIDFDGSILTYNIHSFAKKTVAKLTPADSVGIGLNIFSSYYDERSNSLWLLRSIRETNGWHGNGLVQISITNGEKKHYSWSCYKNITGHDHSAEGMCYDQKRKCFWINSAEGLMQFTLDDKQFHFIGERNSFFNAIDYDRWVGINLDLQGRVWLATIPKGIVIYDPLDRSVTFPFAEGSPLQKEISENNARIYCDRDGIIWSGFWLGKGIYQVLPFSPSFKHFKTDTSTAFSFNIGTIYNFQNSGQGKLWIGSMDGIHRIFDTYTDTYVTLSERDFPPKLRRTRMIPLWIDTLAQKAYLYCFDKGNWVLDMDTQKGHSVIFKDNSNLEINITSQNERGYSVLRDGILFSAVQDNLQIVFFLKKDSIVAHEVISFPLQPGNYFKLGMADDHHMFIKGSNEIGNFTYTVNKQKWIRSPHPLDSILWSHILLNNKDQGYWVVAEKELIHYSKDFKVIKVYTPKDGLPEFDILSLISDTGGNIWFNTDRSIHQLNIETGVFSTLSEKDGYKPQNFSGGAYLHMATDGDLYLGEGVEGEGFVRISPDKYSNSSSAVYLKSLEINQKPFPFSTGVNNLQKLSLKYFQNKISIETGIIEYYSMGKSHIRYKLDGLNDNWQYGPANYTIRFDGLPTGTFTLMMQSSNAANEFIGSVKTLTIHISPPWWKTWWAYFLYVFIFAVLIWSFIQYRSRNLLERNKVLEEKVMNRTNELNLSLEELKETQGQLIQREKMASLGELTSGIAHEIQNPLNFMNNFSELNRELITELKEEMKSGHIEEANALANDIDDNEKKIHHHGKRADAIVKGMLQHSRQSTGQKELTDINALVEEYLRLSYHACLAGKQEGKVNDDTINVMMKTDFDQSLPKINIIPEDIGRVLLNLFNNAFYAVHQKLLGMDNKTSVFTPMVLVVTEKTKNKSGGSQVEVHIKDNGKGIPKNVLDKIFQPFFTTKPTGQGTGLGLYLAYDIIKAHNGSIRVLSNYLSADRQDIEPGTISVNHLSGSPYSERNVEIKEGEFAEFIITLPI